MFYIVWSSVTGFIIPILVILSSWAVMVHHFLTQHTDNRWLET